MIGTFQVGGFADSAEGGTMILRNFLAVICFLFSFSSFAAKEDLNIAIAAEFETLNPIIAQQAATKYILYLAWRPLVYLDLDNKWQPLLIKEIPTLKNKLAKRKGDGLETNIEFIEKAKWGDGEPVTCKDLALAWQVGLSNNVSNANRETYENISSIVIDPKNPKKCTVSFKMAKYDYYQNYPDPIPAHLEEAVFNQFKDQSQAYDKNSLYVKAPTNPGLYNGPYVISEVKLGSHVIFTPNPHFYGKAPPIKKIVVKLLPNNSTHIANLKSGNVDMIPPGAGISIDQAVAFERSAKAENLPFRVEFVNGTVYVHMDLNLENPILADLKVRKALAYGFNRKEMIRALLEDHAQPALHFVPHNDPWFTKDVATYEFSRREANRLLDEAGWKMGPDGIRVKDGKRLSLTIGGAAGTKMTENTETFLQDQYKSMGLEIRQKNEPARVFFGETLKHRRYDLAIFAWVSVPEMSPRSTIHSSSIPTEKNSWSGQNSNSYKNPQVDKLIDQLESELDAQKRAKLAHQVLSFYAQDIPTIPLYFRPNNAVVPKDLKGYRCSGHQFYETLYAENWHF